MAIILDKDLSPKKQVQIAGKIYDFRFNDRFIKKVADTDYQISLIADQVKSLTPDQVNKMSLNQQRDYIYKSFDKVTALVINFFNEELPGENEGRRIYKYYEESAQALSYLIGQLRKQTIFAERQSKNEHRKQYMNNKRR